MVPPLSFDEKQFNNNNNDEYEVTPAESIGDWYRGKNVLISGATGYVGKVLIERFLQLCPNVGCIYMLIRTKKGVDPLTRFEKFTNDLCFQVLRKQNPSAFQKLRLVRGDILEDELGLSSSDRQELIDNVNVVIHCAATVRFNLPLREAIGFNIFGTHRMLELATNMKQLDSFVHVSTAYSQRIGLYLEEKLYPSGNYDVLEMMDMAKLLDTDLMELIKAKIMDPTQCNTYTCTKALAENLVSKYAGRIPVSIARPAIIVCAHQYPMPGYTELLYGPNGMGVGAAHGVFRTLYCRGDATGTYIPVDYVAHACIAIAWNRALQAKSSTNIPIFNIVDTDHSTTWKHGLDVANKEMQENAPYSRMMWYPFGGFSHPWIVYKFWSLLLHYIPALFIDLVLILCFQKPQMIRLYRKFDCGIKEYKPFLGEHWHFSNQNLRGLFKGMTKKDQLAFKFDVWDIDWDEFTRIYVHGIRYYLVKDPPETIPRAKILLKCLYVIDRIAKAVLLALAVYIIYRCLGLDQSKMPTLDSLKTHLDVSSSFIRPVNAENDFS